MNILRHENQVHRDADRVHERAQNSGEATDYLAAAELYHQSGDYKQEATCREAAEALMKEKT
jgi:hypothetical protein